MTRHTPPPNLREHSSSDSYCGICERADTTCHAMQRYCRCYSRTVGRFQVCDMFDKDTKRYIER